MKVVQIASDITLLIFPNRKELTLSMYRIQEFYESPFVSLREHYFTFDDFLDAYALPDGTVDYFSKWGGFNVPAKITDKFYGVFKYGLTSRENAVLAAANSTYLIAIPEGDPDNALEHELAHAYWATDKKYKQKAKAWMKVALEPYRERIYTALLKEEYPDVQEILEDEMHAYVLTSSEAELGEMFPFLPLVLQAQFKEAMQ